MFLDKKLSVHEGNSAEENTIHEEEGIFYYTITRYIRIISTTICFLTSFLQQKQIRLQLILCLMGFLKTKPYPNHQYWQKT